MMVWCRFLRLRIILVGPIYAFSASPCSEMMRLGDFATFGKICRKTQMLEMASDIEAM